MIHLVVLACVLRVTTKKVHPPLEQMLQVPMYITSVLPCSVTKKPLVTHSTYTGTTDIIKNQLTKYQDISRHIKKQLTQRYTE